MEDRFYMAMLAFGLSTRLKMNFPEQILAMGSPAEGVFIPGFCEHPEAIPLPGL